MKNERSPTQEFFFAVFTAIALLQIKRYVEALSEWVGSHMLITPVPLLLKAIFYKQLSWVTLEILSQAYKQFWAK